MPRADCCGSLLPDGIVEMKMVVGGVRYDWEFEAHVGESILRNNHERNAWRRVRSNDLSGGVPSSADKFAITSTVLILVDDLCDPPLFYV